MLEKQREDAKFQKQIIDEMRTSFGTVEAVVEVKKELAVLARKVESFSETAEAFKRQIMEVSLMQDDLSRRLDGAQLDGRSPRANLKRPKKARKSPQLAHKPRTQKCLKCKGQHWPAFKGFCDLDPRRMGVPKDLVCDAWFPKSKPQEFEKHTGYEHVDGNPLKAKLDWHPRCSAHGEWLERMEELQRQQEEDEALLRDENASDDEPGDD